MENKTPKELGFTMPFEGEDHLGTVVEFPYRGDVWRKDAKYALQSFIYLVKVIANYEPVFAIIDPRVKGSEELTKLRSHHNVTFLSLPYDDSWARDNLPVFVRDRNHRLAAVDFGFNAWGGKFNGLYSHWDDDNELGARLTKVLGLRRFPLKDFVLEGGSIHTDGEGTLLVTEECLLSKGRNPELDKEAIAKILCDYLGQKKVIWLPFGVYGDETGGHVDNIARFLDPTHVLLGVTNDEKDPQYRRSQKDFEVIATSTNAQGARLEVVPMPMPKPLYESQTEAWGIKPFEGSKPRKAGNRLAASYVNFYMGHDFIVLPSFGIREDDMARKILVDFYKGSRKVIEVPGREILLGGGNIHCITKEIPSGLK